MSDQLSDTKPPELPTPGLVEVLRLSYRAVSPATRRVVAGVLLVVCVALIVAMLGVRSLDTALLVAVAAFGFGTPFLLLGLGLSLVDWQSSASPESAGGSVETLRTSLPVAFIAVEGYGILTLLTGIGAVLWHFGSGFLLVLLAGVITSLLLLVVYTSTFER